MQQNEGDEQEGMGASAWAVVAALLTVASLVGYWLLMQQGGTL